MTPQESPGLAVRLRAQQAEIDRLRDLAARLESLVRIAYESGRANQDIPWRKSVVFELLGELTGGLSE